MKKRILTPANILFISLFIVTLILITFKMFVLSSFFALFSFVVLFILSLKPKEKKEPLTPLDTIANSLDVMSEGLVILSGDGKVLLANKSARVILSSDDKFFPANILEESPSPALKDLVKRAKDGTHVEAGFILEGVEYQVSADPMLEKGAVEGIALLILREGEKEKSELIRREFTANVSHELKTPLHAISGYAELLKNKMVRPEDTDRFLDNIYSEAQRLVDLIDDTIKLSRLDEGGANMQRECVNLLSLAKKTVKLLETKAERASVTLNVIGDECSLTGIVNLLEGIIFNLVDNAIKYNRENGSVLVEIKESEKTVILSVSDTGIGIPTEFQERVFERFYRVDKSHSKEVGGTGLGLSIVKNAAKHHQAHIELYSVKNGGTSVRVIFPK